MQSCMDGIGVSWPNRWACSWSREVPAKTSDPWVCFGCDWVRKTELVRKWSPPISGGEKASAMPTSVSLTMVRCSRYGSSELRAPALRSKSRPALAGAHRCWVPPQALEPAAPCTISMVMRRVGSRAAAVAAETRPAGRIASRNGRARVAVPTSRRNVRRGRCFPVMNMSLSPGLPVSSPECSVRQSPRLRPPIAACGSTAVLQRRRQSPPRRPRHSAAHDAEDSHRHEVANCARSARFSGSRAWHPAKAVPSAVPTARSRPPRRRRPVPPAAS